jgi:hypothetical protein
MRSSNWTSFRSVGFGVECVNLCDNELIQRKCWNEQLGSRLIYPGNEKCLLSINLLNRTVSTETTLLRISEVNYEL